jgi:4,5:9,10-diseco-3-hydroxy-5,9,17-trioxoandrosta-1(10),2-diene-4-oate hydrolase
MEYGAERYITINGMNIRYAVRGSGPPLLLLHGFCEFLETWDFNLRSLGEYYRVYAMDLPGHGLSDKPYLDYSITFFTDFMVSFMKALDIDRASLVGHSFGGAISIGVAASFPEMVNKLILESSFGLGNDISLLHKLCSVPVLSRSDPEGSRTALEGRINLEFYQPDFAAREIVSRSYRFMQMPEARRVMLNIMHNWVDASGLRPEAVMVDKLPQVKSPTLLIHCEQDRIHPPELSRNAWRLMPNARVKIFDRCGHCSHIERAAEFNETVIDFLEPA